MKTIIKVKENEIEKEIEKSVGIIIGGYENEEMGLSFVLPMTKILEALNLETIKPS